MRSERLRRFFVGPQNLGGFIDILFAALIAPDLEAAIDSRARGDRICLGKYDSVPEKQTLPKMKPMILAEDDPKITTVFPHTSGLQVVTRVGKDFG